MNNNFISREDAKKAYCKNFCNPGVMCPDWYCKEVNDAFDSIPTAAPAQKIAKWIINSDGYYPYCSKCGFKPREMTKFCPNCGAKMEEE